MIIEDKAKEIYDFYDNYGIPLEQKRQCAIFAVDKLIEAFKELSVQESGRVHIDFGHVFWEDVKTFLETYDPYE